MEGNSPDMFGKTCQNIVIMPQEYTTNFNECTF